MVRQVNVANAPFFRSVQGSPLIAIASDDRVPSPPNECHVLLENSRCAIPVRHDAQPVRVIPGLVDDLFRGLRYAVE